MCRLKTITKDDKELYYKGLSPDRDHIEYTEDIHEAERFDSGWFADTKLKWLKFHFPGDKEEYLNRMMIV
jgi:hypothetical protein